MGFSQHFFKICHCSIIRINVIIVTYIVSIVILWRFIHWSNPKHFHTKFLQIIKFLDNSPYIPFSASSRVIKTFWINLINYRFMPPFLFKIFFHTSSTLYNVFRLLKVTYNPLLTKYYSVLSF